MAAGPIPQHFIDELQRRLPLSELIGRKVKLTRKGKEFLGLCPFHQEKTPSFTVNDDKGYYCFGCGASGHSIISFEMASQNCSFVDAVESLARMVGMEVPRLSAAEAEKEEKRASLYDVTEAACAFFQEKLFSPAGKAGLEYLTRRGLSESMVRHFRLGYAPAGQDLLASLKKRGFDAAQLSEAGLVRESENKGGAPWPYFRDRIMFPIADDRGRVIAFGGRIMGDGQPKYLNSPDTPLFHKSETLYAFSYARDVARAKQQIVLVEGYMDVISLHAAGLKTAVAPLGTALTEAQIRKLWRCAPEPVLCFDGDAAGQKAALRALDRTLPLLSPGYSLRFCFLPDKLDPDDFIRARGVGALEALLSGATPFIDVLWDRETRHKKTDTPEEKARLEQAALASVEPIADRTVQKHYRDELKNRLRTLFSPFLAKKRSGRKKPFRTTEEISEAKTALPPGRKDTSALLAYVLLYPAAALPLIDELMMLKLEDDVFMPPLAEALLALSQDKELDSKSLYEMLEANGYESHLQAIFDDMDMLKRKERQAQNPAGNKAAPPWMAVVGKDLAQRLRALNLLALEREIALLEAEMQADFSGTTIEAFEHLQLLREERRKLLEKIEQTV